MVTVTGYSKKQVWRIRPAW